MTNHISYTISAIGTYNINAKRYKFLPVEGANVYDILRHPTLLLTKDAAQALPGVLA